MLQVKIGREADFKLSEFFNDLYGKIREIQNTRHTLQSAHRKTLASEKLQDLHSSG